jgi:hypothetical protein
LVDQTELETETWFAYWSAPVALKDWVARALTVALPGKTVIDASAPGLTASVWVALVIPVALAVSVGLPAFVSR